MTTDNIPHNTISGYKHFKCRCDSCKRANRIEHTRYLMDRSQGIIRSVPAVGASRRLQGLQWMGWTQKQMSEESGLRPLAINRIINNKMEKIRLDTHTKISEVFERLAMTHAPVTPASTQARERARNNNWMPPLAWDDIDDPMCQPEEGSTAEPPFTQSREARKAAARKRANQRRRQRRAENRKVLSFESTTTSESSQAERVAS